LPEIDPGRAARNPSLYRLSYPGCYICIYTPKLLSRMIIFRSHWTLHNFCCWMLTSWWLNKHDLPSLLFIIRITLLPYLALHNPHSSHNIAKEECIEEKFHSSTPLPVRLPRTVMYFFPSVVFSSRLATLLTGMLVRSNNHVITFATDKWFGLIDMRVRQHAEKGSPERCSPRPLLRQLHKHCTVCSNARTRKQLIYEVIKFFRSSHRNGVAGPPEAPGYCCLMPCCRRGRFFINGLYGWRTNPFSQFIQTYRATIRRPCSASTWNMFWP
jgi:hypothetical protein